MQAAESRCGHHMHTRLPAAWPDHDALQVVLGSAIAIAILIAILTLPTVVRLFILFPARCIAYLFRYGVCATSAPARDQRSHPGSP